MSCGQPDPHINHRGDEIRFEWHGLHVAIAFSRLHDSRRDSLGGDIFVTTSIPGVGPHLRWERFNLSSIRTRQHLALDLAKALPSIPSNAWDDMLELACVKTMLWVRAGEPMSLIGGDTVINDDDSLIDGIILRHGPNMIYGTGDSGKSLFILLAALHIDTGLDLLGHATTPTRVAILDYEFDQIQHHKRLQGLAAGAGFTSTPEILYRRCYVPLYQDEALKGYIDQYQVGHVFVDSGAAACGGEPESADVTAKMFVALRALGVGATIVHHSPKNAENKSPFGSAYWYNYSRSIWEVKADHREGEPWLGTTFFHLKNNTGQRERPFGIEYEFSPPGAALNVITFKAATAVASIAGHRNLSLSTRLPEAIKNLGGKASVNDLAKETGEVPNTVRQALLRGQGKAYIKIGDDWGLLQRNIS